MSSDTLQEQCARVRAHIKRWEDSFVSSNGRKPIAKDVAHLDIAKYYRRYDKLKAALKDADSVKVPQPKLDSMASPLRRARALQQQQQQQQRPSADLSPFDRHNAAFDDGPVPASPVPRRVRGPIRPVRPLNLSMDWSAAAPVPEPGVAIPMFQNAWDQSRGILHEGNADNAPALRLPRGFPKSIAPASVAARARSLFSVPDRSVGGLDAAAAALIAPPRKAPVAAVAPSILPGGGIYASRSGSALGGALQSAASSRPQSRLGDSTPASTLDVNELAIFGKTNVQELYGDAGPEKVEASKRWEGKYQKKRNARARSLARQRKVAPNKWTKSTFSRDTEGAAAGAAADRAESSGSGDTLRCDSGSGGASPMHEGGGDDDGAIAASLEADALFAWEASQPSSWQQSEQRQRAARQGLEFRPPQSPPEWDGGDDSGPAGMTMAHSLEADDVIGRGIAVRDEASRALARAARLLADDDVFAFDEPGASMPASLTAEMTVDPPPQLLAAARPLRPGSQRHESMQAAKAAATARMAMLTGGVRSADAPVLRRAAATAGMVAGMPRISKAKAKPAAPAAPAAAVSAATATGSASGAGEPPAKRRKTNTTEAATTMAAPSAATKKPAAKRAATEPKVGTKRKRAPGVGDAADYARVKVPKTKTAGPAHANQNFVALKLGPKYGRGGGGRGGGGGGWRGRGGGGRRSNGAYYQGTKSKGGAGTAGTRTAGPFSTAGPGQLAAAVGAMEGVDDGPAATGGGTEAAASFAEDCGAAASTAGASERAAADACGVIPDAVPVVAAFRAGRLSLQAAMGTLCGHAQFRDGQETAIRRTIEGQSTLLLLPTGWGKSLCYQVPAMLLPGTALVISPLVSLMADQLAGLPSALRGAMLSASQSADDRATVEAALVAGALGVLFVSPELMDTARFRGLLRRVAISFACIDEAHCVSEWSHNFRPAYLRLGRLLAELGVRTVLALTATATAPTRAAILSALRIDAAGLVCVGTRRENLQLSASKPADRFAALVELLKTAPFHGVGSIIVYCMRQHETEAVASHLAQRGIEAACYHAGMESRRRTAVQNSFMSGRLRVIVATVAFGMGVDKSDVRGVVHFSMPRTLENYVQEIGRAGRDGEAALCHMFLSDSDYVRMRSLAYADSLDAGTVLRLLRLIFPAGAGPGTQVAVPMDDTVLACDVKPSVLTTLLVYLEAEGYLSLLSPMYARARLQVPDAAMAGPDSMGGAVASVASASGRGWFDVPLPALAAAAGHATVGSLLGALRGMGIQSELSAYAHMLVLQRMVPKGDEVELARALAGRLTNLEQSALSKLNRMRALAETMVSDEDDPVAAVLAAQNPSNAARAAAMWTAIETYFEEPEPIGDLSASVPSLLLAEREDSAHVRSDVRVFLSSLEGRIRPRAVARIFHGIASPAYQSLTWCRNHCWGRHVGVEFNEILKLAAEAMTGGPADA